MVLRWTTIVAALAVLQGGDAFSVRPSRCSILPRPRMALKSDFASAMPDADTATPYQQLGIEEDNLAIGVDPREVLKYIGTREDLIKKTMTDIEALDQTKAEAEVDKFLLDKEMVNLYIEFQKRREQDPDFVVPPEEEEGLFSFRNIIIVYLGWVAADAVPKIFRNWVAGKEAAGEWEGTNIPFIDDWITKTAATVTEATDSSTVADTVQAVSDVVQSSGAQ